MKEMRCSVLLPRRRSVIKLVRIKTEGVLISINCSDSFYATIDEVGRGKKCTLHVASVGSKSLWWDSSFSEVAEVM